MSILGNPAGGIFDGRTIVTTAGTRVQLSTTSLGCRSVIITAETDNTGIVTVGGSTVVGTVLTRRGEPLNAGESISFDINDISDIWLDSTISGDGVTYTALVV